MSFSADSYYEVCGMKLNSLGFGIDIESGRTNGDGAGASSQYTPPTNPRSGTGDGCVTSGNGWSAFEGDGYALDLYRNDLY